MRIEETARRVALVAIASSVLAGCGAAAPLACPTAIALAPTSIGQPAHAVIGPMSVDASGTDVRLHLDARVLRRAHLMIDTPHEPGNEPSFSVALAHADGTAIVEGWPVPLETGTFVNLEWSPPAGVETDVVLHVASRTADARDLELTVALFDPLE